MVCQGYDADDWLRLQVARLMMHGDAHETEVH